jgi:hypothetical protein
MGMQLGPHGCNNSLGHHGACCVSPSVFVCKEQICAKSQCNSAENNEVKAVGHKASSSRRMSIMQTRC